MNFCKDCMHFEETRIDYYPYPAGIVIDTRCTHPATVTYEPVYGKRTISGDTIRCREYRAEVSHIENKCGPEGKHFEDKYGLFNWQLSDAGDDK